MYVVKPRCFLCCVYFFVLSLTCAFAADSLSFPYYAHIYPPPPAPPPPPPSPLPPSPLPPAYLDTTFSRSYVYQAYVGIYYGQPPLPFADTFSLPPNLLAESVEVAISFSFLTQYTSLIIQSCGPTLSSSGATLLALQTPAVSEINGGGFLFEQTWSRSFFALPGAVVSMQLVCTCLSQSTLQPYPCATDPSPPEVQDGSFNLTFPFYGFPSPPSPPAPPPPPTVVFAPSIDTGLVSGGAWRLN